MSRAKTVNGIEYDIVIRPLNLCIEYSGTYWHEGKTEKDQAKRKLCESNSINFIEIIQNKLFSRDNIELTPTRIEYNPLKDRDGKGKTIVEYIKSLYNVDGQIDYDEVIRQAIEYSKGKIEYSKSLAFLNPEIAEEWNYELNNGLKPEEVTPGSQTKVWFTCKEGHNYKASICSRTNLNSDCPYCKNKKVLTGYNDLATTHPELLKEWDYMGNGDLKPTDIVAGSYKKVHWICSLCGYKWVIVAAERTKHKKVVVLSVLEGADIMNVNFGNDYKQKRAGCQLIASGTNLIRHTR